MATYNLTTSYKTIKYSDSQDYAVVWTDGGNNQVRLYCQAKIQSQSSSTTTIRVRLSFRMRWSNFSTNSLTIKTTGDCARTFYSGSASYSRSQSSYAEMWSKEEDFAMDTTNNSFTLGATMSYVISSGTYTGTISNNTCTFTIPMYTITYDANGGTNAPASQTQDNGVPLTLTTATPSRSPSLSSTYTITYNGNNGTVIGDTTATSSCYTSYTFNSWNTAADGSGTSYASGANYTANTSAILYAQWTSTNGQYEQVVLPSAFRQGYVLLGWSTNSSATTPDTGKDPGASWRPSSNTALYAVWQVQNVTLKLCQEMFDLIWPIGSIYTTIANVDPSTLFGGTWVRIGTGRTLISAGGGVNPVSDSNTDTARGTYTGVTTDFAAGDRGGESDHQLVETEMPKHSHKIRTNYTSSTSHGHYGHDSYCATGINVDGHEASFPNSQQTGGDGTHNNIQPYLAVYMWQRTA